MWESLGTANDGYRLVIRATRVSLRQLVAIIVACVVGGGALVTAIMIAFTTETGVTLGRSAVVVVGGGLAVVVSLALLWVFSWRRKHYTIDWDEAGVQIASAGLNVVRPWASISRILVRTDTDYARVEVWGSDNTSVTLLAGFGSQEVKRVTAIDQIPAGVVELLRRHRLFERPPARNALGLRIFVLSPS